MSSKTTDISSKVDKLINSSSVDNLKPKEQDKEKICTDKIKKVEKRFNFFRNKKVSKKNLQDLSKQIRDTLEFVVSAYPENMPQSLLNKLFTLYNYENVILEKLNEKNSDEYQKQVEELKFKYESKYKRLSNQMDNIWGNVLSVILSFSIVAAMVEGISKIDKEYMFLFCLVIVWLGMTLLVFFSNLFENKKLGRETAKFMYIIVTILTLIVGTITIYNSQIQNIKNINSSNENKNNVVIDSNDNSSESTSQIPVIKKAETSQANN